MKVVTLGCHSIIILLAQGDLNTIAGGFVGMPRKYWLYRQSPGPDRPLSVYSTTILSTYACMIMTASSSHSSCVVGGFTEF